MSIIILICIAIQSLKGVSCASFSSASRHHPSDGNQRHQLHPPPSSDHQNKPMSAALRTVRAPASLEIMPMGDIKKAVGEQFVVICRGTSNPDVTVTNLKWFNPRGEEIFPSQDISIISTNNHEKKQLAFMKPSINDAGVYTCSGRSTNGELLEAKVRVVIYGKRLFHIFPYHISIISTLSSSLLFLIEFFFLL